MKYELHKKKGRIRINVDLFEYLSIEQLKLFFSNFYVMNVETIEFGDKMYYGYSEHFEEAKGEGFIIPQYTATLNEDKTIEFNKN